MKRLGCFHVSGKFFDNLDIDEGVNVFHRMVVLRASEDFRCFRVTYIAYHPDFDEVKEGEIVPLYYAEFSPDSVYPKWKKATPDSDDVLVGTHL